MKKIITTIILASFTLLSKAQLVTTLTLTPQQLVQNVLLGTGVTATNITFTGDLNAIAKFNATASTNIGILAGVYLSTGNASTASPFGPQGPNSSPSNGTNLNKPGDTQLNAVSGNTTFDAAVLEFDFVPTGDSVKFRYCFASEEYPEYVNAGVNDAFAFFLTGPNPSGGNYTNKNIALIPGSSTPVSIDNVNAGSNAAYYRSNAGNTINSQFDGFTTILYALEKVVCGQTYHIKIAIADGGDGIYDSGVFLEGGSFSSLPPLNVFTVNSSTFIPDSILVEDCNTYCAYFIRHGNIANADSFQLTVGGNAILGTDYEQVGNPSFSWPTVLHFAANQDTIKFCNIKAFQDNLVEGTDTIKFEMSSFITSSVSCLSSNALKFNLYIKDYIPITIGQGDVGVCSGATVTLNANASNGYPAYTYTWTAPTANTPTITTPPINSPTVYTITVNDICNKPVTKQVTLTPVAVPTVVVNSATVCAGYTATLTATGATTYSWSTGVSNDTLLVTPSANTNYTVIGANGLCTNTAVTSVTVIGVPLSITGDNSICNGESTVLTASGSTTYTWNTGSTAPSITVTPSANTTYSVTSAVGACINFTVYPVTVNAIPTLTLSGSPYCAGQSTTITALGADTYSWSTGQTTSSISVTPTVNATYTVIGTSVAGCTSTAVYSPTLNTAAPQITNTSPVVFCLDSILNITVRIEGGNSPYGVEWLLPSGGIVPFDTTNYTYSFTQSVMPSNGTYTIVVTDQCLYKDTLVMDINSVDCNVIVPNVVTPNGDGVNEYFKINGLERFPGSQVIIYNRWGNKLYSSDDYKNDWKPNVTSGTYFYLLNVSDGRKFQGFFQVFKD